MRDFTGATGSAPPSENHSLFNLSLSYSSPQRFGESQIHVDHFVVTLFDHLKDPVSFGSLLAGGGSYRLARVAVMKGLKIPFLAREISFGAGVATEAMAFEMSRRAMEAAIGRENPHHFQWQGEQGIKNGFIPSLISFSLFHGAGGLARGQNQVTQHLLQDGAMVAGHQAAAALHFMEKPEGTLAEQWAQAEGMNWQMRGMMTLIHAGLPQVSALERGLDLSLRARETKKPSPDFFISNQDPALVSVSASESRASVSPKLFSKEPQPSAVRPMLSVQEGEGGGAERAHRHGSLKKEFGDSLQKIFPSSDVIEEVLQTALDLSTNLKEGDRHFLSAVIHSQVKDPLGLYMSTVALREVFRRNPLRGTGGSYEEALVQLFAEEALRDPDTARRGFAFRALHQTLSGGVRTSQMEGILKQFGYGEEHAQDPELDRITSKKMLDLFRFRSKQGVFYPEDKFSEALEFAVRSPFSGLALSWLFRLFSSVETPPVYKIDEFQFSVPDDMGRRIVEKASTLSGERLVDEFNGTSQTASLADRRLTAKIVSVRQSEYQYRVVSPMQKLHNRVLLLENVEKYLKDQESLLPQERVSRLLALLRLNPTPVSEQIAKDFEDGKFEVVLMSPEVFDAEALRSPSFYPDSLSRIVRRGPREIPQIILKDLPHTLPSDSPTAPLSTSANAVVSLLSHWVMEWERLRQSSLEGPLEQSNWRAMDLARLQSEERKISEMMVFLEAQRWRLANGFFTEWELADRLGGIVKHARGYVERFIK